MAIICKPILILDFLFLCLFVMLELEHRALGMLGKCSTTELFFSGDGVCVQRFETWFP